MSLLRLIPTEQTNGLPVLTWLRVFALADEVDKRRAEQESRKIRDLLAAIQPIWEKVKNSREWPKGGRKVRGFNKKATGQ